VPNVPSYGLLLRFTTAQGAEVRLGTAGSEVVSVAGFGAVQRPGLNDRKGQSCLLIVDVAQGQSLWVGFADTESEKPAGGYQGLCEKAKLAASSVLHELRVRRR
jgi:hypothetical protein